jgi:hypothetical protein
MRRLLPHLLFDFVATGLRTIQFLLLHVAGTYCESAKQILWHEFPSLQHCGSTEHCSMNFMLTQERKFRHEFVNRALQSAVQMPLLRLPWKKAARSK